MKELKARQMHIDILKILSCFLVIVNHTNSRVFRSTEPSITWFASVGYFFVSKPAVPLFLMCSGAVLLGRVDSYRRWLSRVLRVVIVLVLFSFLYYFVFQQKEPLSFLAVIRFLLTMIRAQITTAYWYLYLYLAILLMLPFLQRMVKNFQKKDYQLFLLITVLIMGTLPILFHYLDPLVVPDVVENKIQMNAYFTGSLFSVYVGLFVAGYYFNGDYQKETRRGFWVALALYVGLLILQILLTYREYLLDPVGFLFFDGRTLSTITVSAFALFYMVKYLAARIRFSERAKQVICGISGCTFGIYLLSDLFILKFSPIYTRMHKAGMHAMLAMVIFEVLVFASGLAVTFLLKKIPVISKLL